MAVRADLKALPDAVARGGMAALAVALARKIDDPATGPTSVSMNARVLERVLENLAKVTPARPDRDVVDDLELKRAERRAAVAARS